MRRYSIEPKTRKYVKGYGFLSFAGKYKKQLLDTGPDSLKTPSKKVVHKANEFIGNKIADALTKSNEDEIVKPDENSRNAENPRNKRWNIKQIEKSIIKMEHYKISKLLNDSICNKKMGGSK